MCPIVVELVSVFLPPSQHRIPGRRKLIYHCARPAPRVRTDFGDVIVHYRIAPIVEIDRHLQLRDLVVAIDHVIGIVTRIVAEPCQPFAKAGHPCQIGRRGRMIRPAPGVRGRI